MTIREGVAPSESTREALTRVLATEGRNALAQVELAASELARLETNPVRRSRIDAIRSAADEIESLLGKIDLLAQPEAPSPEARESVDMAVIVEAVLARLSPVLVARGVILSWSETGAHDANYRVDLPAHLIEAMCIDLTRLVVAELEHEAPLEVGVRSTRDEVELVLGVPRHCVGSKGIGSEVAFSDGLELEVALAEWQGRLEFLEVEADADEANEPRSAWRLVLPATSRLEDRVAHA